MNAIAEGPLTLAGADAFKDATAPSLTVTEPEDGIVVELSTVAVKGTCTDAHLQTFTVNGEETPRDGSGAFEKAVFLSGGAWGTTIDAVAEDEYRNVTVVTRTVEAAPLEVQVASPADGAVLDATSVTVTGTVKGPRDAEVFVNGQRAERNGESFTLASLPLTEGENVITAHAMTPHTFSEHTVLVIRDTTNPVVTIYSPQDGDIIGAATVNVEGWVEDDSLQTVTVNGQTAELFGSYFVAENVPLNTEGGDNSIEVVATDAVGHTGEAEVAVTRDTTAPSLAITSPANGSTVHTRLVTVSGTVSDASLREVEVNGWQAALGSGTFSRANIALDIEGQNTITAIARDAVGHESQVSVTVTRNLPPVVAITSVVFSDRSTDELLRVKITGTVDDATALTTGKNETHPRIWVKLPNGQWKQEPNVVDGTHENGSFEVDGVVVYPGDNLLLVWATDPQGVTGWAEVVVSVENPSQGYELPETEQPEVIPTLTVAVLGRAEEGSPLALGMLGGETFMTFGELAIQEATGSEPALTVRTTQLVKVFKASDLRFDLSAAFDCSYELYSATLSFPKDPPDIPVGAFSVFNNGNADPKAKENATVVALDYTGPDPKDPTKTQTYQFGGFWWEVDCTLACRTDRTPKGTAEGIKATGVLKRKKDGNGQWVGDPVQVPNSNRVDVLVDEITSAKVTVYDSVTGEMLGGLDAATTERELRLQPDSTNTEQRPMWVEMTAETRFGKKDGLQGKVKWAIKEPDAIDLDGEKNESGQGRTCTTIDVNQDGMATYSIQLGITYIMAFGEADAKSDGKYEVGKAGPPPDNWPSQCSKAMENPKVDRNPDLTQLPEHAQKTWTPLESMLPTGDKPFKIVVARVTSVEFWDDRGARISEPNKYFDLNGQEVPLACVGVKYYPDKESHNGGSRRIVHVRVNVKPCIPGIPVYVDSFDVDDPSTDDPAIDSTPGPGEGSDNRVRPCKAGVLLATGRQGTTEEGGTVHFDNDGFVTSMRPGDNFRVAATLFRRDGLARLLPDCVPVQHQYPGFGGRLSETLTIWRKLRMEFDVMNDPTFAENTTSGSGTWTWDPRFNGPIGQVDAKVMYAAVDQARQSGGGANYWKGGCAKIWARNYEPVFARVRASECPASGVSTITLWLPPDPVARQRLIKMLTNARYGDIVLGDDDFEGAEATTVPSMAFIRGDQGGIGAAVPMRRPSPAALDVVSRAYRQAYIDVVHLPPAGAGPRFKLWIWSPEGLELPLSWIGLVGDDLADLESLASDERSVGYMYAHVVVCFQPRPGSDMDGDSDGGGDRGYTRSFPSCPQTCAVFSEVAHEYTAACRTGGKYDYHFYLGQAIAHEVRHTLLGTDHAAEGLGREVMMERDIGFDGRDLARLRERW